MAHGSQRGFTLAEMLVSMLVAAVFGLTGFGFYRSELRTLTDQSAMLDATEKIRGSMGFLTRELHQTGYDPMFTAMVVPGSKGIVDAGPNYLWIQFDANGNGAIDPSATDPNAESILYTYDAANQQVVRTVAGVAQPLVKNVPAGGFSFQYFDLLGNQLSPASSPPSLPSSLTSQLPSSVLSVITNGSTQTLNAAQRDLVALVRINVQVQVVGTPLAPTSPPVLRLSERVVVPSRILDRL